jgi:hypothetical protein
MRWRSSFTMSLVSTSKSPVSVRPSSQSGGRRRPFAIWPRNGTKTSVTFTCISYLSFARTISSTWMSLPAINESVFGELAGPPSGLLPFRLLDFTVIVGFIFFRHILKTTCCSLGYFKELLIKIYKSPYFNYT